MTSSRPVLGSATDLSDEPMTQTSCSVNLRRATQSAPDDGSFDEFDVVPRLDRSVSLNSWRGLRASEGEVRPIRNNASAAVEVQAPGAAGYLAPHQSPSPLPSALSNTRPPLSVNQLPSEIVPPIIDHVTRRGIDLSGGSEERPSYNQRIPASSTSAVLQVQGETTVDPSSIERRAFYPPNPTRQDLRPGLARGPQVNVQPPTEVDNLIEVSRLSGRRGSGCSSPIDPSLDYHQGEKEDTAKLADPPLRGYYRLYTVGRTLFSVNPAYGNDISLSSFDIEHVSPPRLARNYIAFISHRERIKPSGVKMYLTRPGASPELIKNLDTVINMDPYYRLFGVAQSSKGCQQPMPSRYPLYDDDHSLTTFFTEDVPPPLRVKDYIAYISQKEGIHQSRISLFLRRGESESVGSEIETVAEVQEVTNVNDIVTAKRASFSSEKDPILVKVKLEVDKRGNVLFGTKNKPLARFSIRWITWNFNRQLSKWQRRVSTVY
ncbi:hypothetical protein FRC05_002820 [Tulasnella sp. 425]|nr:hypothetical protein FRC05_002820 [Tulasnella sp. 425]